MSTLVWLGLVLAALWLLGRLLERHIQVLVLLLSDRPATAAALYDLLVLPGVVLHELSHAAVAVMLRVPVISVDLFRFRRGRDARQGEVVVARVDPLRMSLIGAAPLLAGTAVLLVLVGAIGPLPPGFAAIAALPVLLGSARSALLLYLLFAVANTMFPSASDRAAWWPIAVIVAGLTLLLLAFGVRPEVPAAWTIGLVAAVQRLLAALVPVLTLDVVLLCVVIAGASIAGRLRGRRVLYR